MTVPAAPGRLRDRVRALPERTPLRVRLVAALLALAALALLATGVAATAALRGYLISRVDDQLRTTARLNVERPGRGPIGPGAEGHGNGRFEVPNAFYLQVSAADGTVLAANDPDAEPPALPTLDVARLGDRANAPFTVPSKAQNDQDGPDWRALVVPFSDGSGAVTTALSLDDVDATVARLTRINLVVGLLVLALLAGLAYAVVRRSLRPLVEVEETARAIAAGNLGRRVPDRDPRTEVGRLSAALNGMLAQIETAFRARSASEGSARASEERMRRFVADASHELRTPLTSIRGFAELYRQGAATSPDDTARLMRRIEDEAKRMGLLVEDLLLLARLDQQRPLEQQPVDLLRIAADAVHDANAVAPDHPVDLRLLPTGPAPIVRGDEARLRQVLANLVSNALRHTPAGTPVTVAVGASTEEAVAVLEVSDAGPGLPPEQAARVFERFYRADTSRTRDHGGAGLGLSIVAALVAAHAGTVALDTEPGRGATFRVRLPLMSLPLTTENGAGLSADGKAAPRVLTASRGTVALPKTSTTSEEP